MPIDELSLEGGPTAKIKEKAADAMSGNEVAGRRLSMSVAMRRTY
jgi:hypothetical protein